MKKKGILLLLVAIVLCLSNCYKAQLFEQAQYDPRMSAGLATVFDETSKAFGHPVDGLNYRQSVVHGLGDNSFSSTFVTAPAPFNSGLGPVFNNVSCISCHHNDGKGSPTAGLSNSSLFLRISIPGMDIHGGANPVPMYGTQLKNRAIFGKTALASVVIKYQERTVTYPDGTSISLRTPTYSIENPYKPLPENIMISPRMAPPIFGIGLLDLIPESTILSFASTQAQENDGVHGKPNYIWDPYLKKKVLGKFGLKANNPSILVQSAAAYQQDMGVTNYVFPQESLKEIGQSDGLNDDPELADSILNNVVFYIKTLAVPARRNTNNPDVMEGEKLFSQINCKSCHVPSVFTGVDITVPAISRQRIQAFTDLLLHDMGEALADHRPDFEASGTQWRTSPLWGIGLFPKTNGTPFYLHDGRARSIEEAILWHGGEAENAKNRFMKLGITQRKQIINFLNSL